MLCMCCMYVHGVFDINYTRWLNKSPNLGNVSHKQGEVTPKQWAETRTVSGRSSLKMIFAAILTYMCEKGGSIE